MQRKFKVFGLLLLGATAISANLVEHSYVCTSKHFGYKKDGKPQMGLPLKIYDTKYEPTKWLCVSKDGTAISNNTCSNTYPRSLLMSLDHLIEMNLIVRFFNDPEVDVCQTAHDRDEKEVQAHFKEFAGAISSDENIIGIPASVNEEKASLLHPTWVSTSKTGSSFDRYPTYFSPFWSDEDNGKILQTYKMLQLEHEMYFTDAKIAVVEGLETLLGKLGYEGEKKSDLTGKFDEYLSKIYDNYHKLIEESVSILEQGTENKFKASDVTAAIARLDQCAKAVSELQGYYNQPKWIEKRSQPYLGHFHLIGAKLAMISRQYQHKTRLTADDKKVYDRDAIKQLKGVYEDVVRKLTYFSDLPDLFFFETMTAARLVEAINFAASKGKGTQLTEEQIGLLKESISGKFLSGVSKRFESEHKRLRKAVELFHF